MKIKLGNTIIFLLCSILLQTILFIINLDSYHIIVDELSKSELMYSKIAAAAELALFILLTALSLLHILKGKSFSWRSSCVIILLPIAYLVTFIYLLDDITPHTVSRWILSDDKIIFYQLLCITPIIFYFLLKIADFTSYFSQKKDILLSLLVTIVTPATIYITFTFVLDVFYSTNKLIEFLLPVFLIIATLIMLIALLRLLLHLFSSCEKRKIFQIILYIVISLVLPIGGLVLNRTIPFPVDLQNIYVYFLAVINGLLLITPTLSRTKLNNFLVYLRVSFFSFTCYFFVLFLPFLPLSIPAIVAVGAGFLILTPTLLFIIHSKRLVIDFNLSFQSLSQLKRKLLFLSAFCLIPLIITTTAISDKISLNQSLHYFFETDYNHESKFEGNLWFAKRGLEKLIQKKHGVYTPLLSGFYNWIVFDNLTIADSKINYMYASLCGENYDYSKNNHSNFGNIFAQPGQRIDSSGSTNFLASDDVIITDIKQSSEVVGELTKTVVKLTMKNLTDWQKEFRTSIEIPDGVFISGYWLHIDNTPVKGQIFEKKSAIWVYENIKRTQRDPGLLYYVSPNTLHLKVFPFSNDETRINEIEFLYPTKMSCTIKIGNNTILLDNDRAMNEKILLAADNDILSILLTAEQKATLPITKRSPYFHFIIDWSKDSAYATSGTIDTIKQIMADHAQVEYCKITLANFESFTITETIINKDQLSRLSLKSLIKSFKPKGGFCKELAFKKLITAEMARTFTADSDALLYPLFVVLADKDSLKPLEKNMSYFTKLLPDSNYYLELNDKELLSAYDFNGNTKPEYTITSNNIHLFKIDNKLYSCTTDTTSSIIHTQAEKKNYKLELYDQDLKKFISISNIHTLNKSSIYAEALLTQNLSYKRVYNPALSNELFKNLVLTSKKSGILNNLGAYIVVENSAQWKILSKKEQQKLKNKETLDTIDSPEPSLWILLILLLLTLLFYKKFVRYKKKRKTSSVKNS